MIAKTKDGYAPKACNWGLKGELINSYEDVRLINDSSAIVAVDNGFMKIENINSYSEPDSVVTFIRKVTDIRNGSVISYGSAFIELPFSENSLRINFSTAEFVGSSEILFMYRLKGIDNQWSIPSSSTSKEYTNLPEGKYIFEVKACFNDESITSTPATISITIRSPWYRSTSAYVFYLLFIMLTLWILYKKTISKQKKTIRRKEEELLDKTLKYEEDAKMKEQEIYRLQNENLQNELKLKAQELNGYILNIIRKNEILEEVRKNASNISTAIDEGKDTGTIKQRVIRLISQICNNIEHDNDFEIFKSNFDLVHKHFFMKLEEKFPKLTRNEKILCAYLNMNLSTKEIASLFNISERGVEVNRYRLRKKLKLEREVNLSHFMQQLSNE
jgi:DNA-binding CsgD family transcriptional regulator